MELTTKQKISASISKNIPTITAKIINGAAYGLLALVKFIRQLIADARS